MEVTREAWKAEQSFEADWWGDCTNTFGEELKHPTYARHMGLQMINDGGKIYIDQTGRSVLDIGGGPASMTLKVRGATRRTVLDPCPYPQWVIDRYEQAGIEYLAMPAEDLLNQGKIYDEVWIYNVLQHVMSPEVILDVACETADVIRLFEWTRIAPHPGHPHELTAEKLLGWGNFNHDDGWWEESKVVWEHWIGPRYLPDYAFHGYQYL